MSTPPRDPLPLLTQTTRDALKAKVDRPSQLLEVTTLVVADLVHKHVLTMDDCRTNPADFRRSFKSENDYLGWAVARAAALITQKAEELVPPERRTPAKRKGRFEDV